VVNLPTLVLRDTMITLTVTYNGRLEPQTPDRETVAVAAAQVGQLGADDLPMMSAERSFLYSNRSHWYPQAPFSDYATARLRINVPAGVECVGSGTLAPGYPRAVEPADGGSGDPALARKVYLFNATQPLRYLAIIISRLVRADAPT